MEPHGSWERPHSHCKRKQSACSVCGIMHLIKLSFLDTLIPEGRASLRSDKRVS